MYFGVKGWRLRLRLGAEVQKCSSRLERWRWRLRGCSLRLSGCSLGLRGGGGG